jgi:hypothetical protein
MASIVLSSVGNVIGNAFLPGIGGRLLGSYGASVGKELDGSLGLSGSTSSDKTGPQIQNLRVQDSRYGKGIPLVFGSVRVAGNVIWSSDLIETVNETSTSSGKGGSFGVGGTKTTYSYSIHCAVAIAEGEIGGIQTIWADSKIIYQNGVWKDGVISSATIYTGTTTQNPDPLMQSCLGLSAVPAYRGLAYIVFESLQLANFSNRLPSLSFEIYPAAAVSAPYWLGQATPNIYCTKTSVTGKGMPPIVIDGNDARARTVIVGGYNVSGSATSFQIIAYDVTGDAPVRDWAATSGTFTIGTVYDQSWAVSSDGRFVAIVLISISGPTTSHRIALFDSEAQSFGPIFSIDLPNAGTNCQVAWIDATHFVISSVSNTNRGVHVFSRAGLGVVDLGFFNVWGSGSLAAMQTYFYTQFSPCPSGGLYAFTVDQAPYFSYLYSRQISWSRDVLTVGSLVTVSNNFKPPSTTGGMIPYLLDTGDGELTFFIGSTSNMMMMSFQPGPASAQITRPWQTLVNTGWSYTGDNHPVVFGDRIVVLQTTYDSYYYVSEISLDNGGFSFASQVAQVGPAANGAQLYGTFAIDASRFLVLVVGGFSNQLSILGIIRRYVTGCGLDAVVGSILQRAGYAASDYDVTALSGSTVDGFVIDDPMTAAAALQPLQIFEPFDLIESDQQLRAVLHGNTATVSLPSSELRASADPNLSKIQPSRVQSRMQELDLPAQITLDYLDASRDYEIGTVRAVRTATRGAREVVKIAMPLVCSSDAAKQMAETRLYTAWAERDQASLTLSRKWLGLDPNDIVDLGDRLMRVADVQLKGGVLSVHGALIPTAPVTSAATTDPTSLTSSDSLASVASALFLMNMPLLRTDDDQPGVYAAVSGTDGWRGATLMRSADDVSFGTYASFNIPASAGYATSVLADASSFYMDCVNSVTVQLLQGTLSSCAQADLLNGANVALLGGEILQFQTATLIGPNCYMLSLLLRGRRGTEDQIGIHQIDESFVLLTPSALQFLPCLLTDRNTTYDFAAVSNGQTLGQSAVAAVTYNLATIQPYAPAQLAGSRSAGKGTDLALSWIRRARLNGDWADYVDVPLDEPVELYDVEIMNGANVMRTFSGLTTNSVVYTAAEQASDWGSSIPSQFTVNVYQISSRYGRGKKTTATI